MTVYDRAFSCWTEDVLDKGVPGPQLPSCLPEKKKSAVIDRAYNLARMFSRSERRTGRFGSGLVPAMFRHCLTKQLVDCATV